MVSKRKAGKIAHRLAVKVYRGTRRKSKIALRKLYSAKVGKSKFNKLTGRFGRKRFKRTFRKKRFKKSFGRKKFRRSFRRKKRYY